MNNPTLAEAPTLKAEVDLQSLSETSQPSLMKDFIRILTVGSIIAASYGFIARIIIDNLN